MLYNQSIVIPMYRECALERLGVNVLGANIVPSASAVVVRDTLEITLFVQIGHWTTLATHPTFV